MKANQIISVFMLFGCSIITVLQEGMAQDLELFELDTFIEPRELRTTLSGEPARSRAFLASRLLFGADYNYQVRNQFTRATIDFIRIDNNFYYSSFQGSIKLTYLNTLRGAEQPTFKSKVQLGLYKEDKEHHPTSEDFASGRFTFSWNVEKRNGAGFIHECALEMDFFNSYGESPGFGGFIAALTIPSKEQDFLLWYVGYALRVIVYRAENGLAWRYGLGISGEKKDDDWRGGVFRNEVSVELPIKSLSSSLHLIYSLSCHLRGKSLNHEIGAFLNVPILAHLF